MKEILSDKVRKFIIRLLMAFSTGLFSLYSLFKIDDGYGYFLSFINSAIFCVYFSLESNRSYKKVKKLREEKNEE